VIHKGASHFAAAVFERLFKSILPLDKAYGQTSLISQITTVTSRF
jgi:hypothetical protein